MLDKRLIDAQRELSQKSRGQIEEETAFKWAARAAAAYVLFEASPRKQQWLLDSAHYFEEACEHAALADDTGAVLYAVRMWLNDHIPRGAF